MNDKKHNLIKKNIRDFTAEDTLYIQKTERGHLITYFVKFVKFEGGMVHGEIIEVEPDWVRVDKGTPIKARLGKCYLFGDDGYRWHRCHWFNKEGFAE